MTIALIALFSAMLGNNGDNRVSLQNFRKIEAGMSLADVERILGPATRSSLASLDERMQPYVVIGWVGKEIGVCLRIDHEGCAAEPILAIQRDLSLIGRLREWSMWIVKY